MSGRARDRGHAETLTERMITWIVPTAAEIVAVVGTYTLKAGDQLVFVDSALADMTITLPPKAEAAGNFYFIQAPDGGTQDVSVFDYELGTEIATYGDMDTDDDHALFFCTGQAWITVFDGVA